MGTWRFGTLAITSLSDLLPGSQDVGEGRVEAAPWSSTVMPASLAGGREPVGAVGRALLVGKYIGVVNGCSRGHLGLFFLACCFCTL